MARLALSCLLALALAAPASAEDPWADPASRPPGQAPATAPASPPPGYAPAEKPRRLELTAFAGWEVSSNVTTSTGTLHIDDAPGFGVSLDWTLGPGQQAELLWLYSSTDARLQGTVPGAQSSVSFPVDSHWFQLGGTYAVSRGQVEPFVSGSLGAALYLPGTVTFEGGGTYAPAATWRFAFSLGVGTKIWLGDRVGLRLQARMLAPVLFQSAAFYSGPAGAAFLVNAGIPYVQGDFGVGLVFAP